MNRRLIACAALALQGALLSGGPALAQSFPSKPIRIMIPFSAGGTTDILGRTLAIPLAEALGQQVIVENRPGAGGVIGADAVAKAPPDGHTFGIFNTTHAVTPFVMKLPYDAVKDFAGVSLIILVPGLMSASPTLPATNVREIIDYARKNPGKLSYALPGSLTSGHLSMELLKQMTGVDIVAIPYKGAAPAFADLMSGQVQLIINSPPSSLPHVRSGKLRAIATTGATRSAGLPEIPTIAESGFPGFDTVEWYGMFTHGKAPREAVERMSREVAKVVATQAFRERMLTLGAEAKSSAPDEYDRFVHAEMQRWGKLAKDLNLKPD